MITRLVSPNSSCQSVVMLYPVCLRRGVLKRDLPDICDVALRLQNGIFSLVRMSLTFYNFIQNIAEDIILIQITPHKDNIYDFIMIP